MKIIDEVMTFAEASMLWKLADSTLRKSAERRKFSQEEVRKSCKTWLITKKAMEKHYGKQKND